MCTVRTPYETREANQPNAFSLTRKHTKSVVSIDIAHPAYVCVNVYWVVLVCECVHISLSLWLSPW